MPTFTWTRSIGCGRRRGWHNNDDFWSTLRYREDSHVCIQAFITRNQYGTSRQSTVIASLSIRVKEGGRWTYLWFPFRRAGWFTEIVFPTVCWMRDIQLFGSWGARSTSWKQQTDNNCYIVNKTRTRKSRSINQINPNFRLGSFLQIMSDMIVFCEKQIWSNCCEKKRVDTDFLHGIKHQKKTIGRKN